MKRTMILLALVAVVAFGAFAQTANQTVTLNVNAIYKIAVTGAPAFTIAATDFTAGATSATVSDATTAKYSYTTNTTTNKVSAALDADLPTGLSLTCDMGSGAVALTNAAATVVSNLSRGASNNVAITYALTASTDADPVVGASRIVTFTFSN